MRARLSSRPWSFYVKVWIVAYCGLFGLLMTVFVPEGFQMALSHVRGSLSTSQPSGMSSSSSRDAVENTCPPCDCRSCVGENTHGNEVRRFPTLPPNEAMVSSTPWPQDSGVNKRVEMLSAKMAHPLLQFASREKHIAHADMANEVVHVSQGQQNMTSSSSSSSSLSLSCQLLRKKWLARDLNDNVRGIPQQDSLYVRTPCASPVCIRRRDWECTQNPISHITRDGIIMRKGNLQPCCDDLLDTLIVTVIGIFSRHNITAFPAMGSLLSTVRDGRINPWTGDADVAVMQYEETWKPKLIADFNAAGLIYFESSWGRVCFHLNHPGLVRKTIFLCFFFLTFFSPFRMKLLRWRMLEILPGWMSYLSCLMYGLFVLIQSPCLSLEKHSMRVFSTSQTYFQLVFARWETSMLLCNVRKMPRNGSD